MKILSVAVASALLVASPTSAFVPRSTSASKPSNGLQVNSPIRQSLALASSPAELAGYLAKAHEEKLKAIKDAEAKKNVEIEALKKELEQLKGGKSNLAVASASTNVMDESKEEIASKLIAYQQFMTKYIVESHQQKVMAVKAAEEAVAQRYEAKLQLLLGGAAPEASSASSSPVVSPQESTSYTARSAKVSAAAKAGKSRWGDFENARAAGAPLTTPPVPKAVTASNPTVSAPQKAAVTNIGASIVKGVSPEVVAADHGLRADGGVGGFTLAERVAMGKDVLEVNTSYAARSAKVAAAAKAGKSRWGDFENAIAAGAPLTSLPVPKAVAASNPTVSAPKKAAATNFGTNFGASIVNGVSPEVVAADHGLRADGGVGGFTLAERVAMGKDVLEGNGATINGASQIATAGSTPPPVYLLRNAKIAAAAKAGKSRWGPQEIERAQSIVSASASLKVLPDVEAADHGLRADGGVGGPTLADRVNLGASLLGN